MAIERLSTSDEIMLWPDESWPQEIGALAVLDGAPLFDTDGRFRIERVREVIASRLSRLPRLRQLLYVPPRDLGGPLWIDDPTFDISAHVQAISVAAPDEDALLCAVEEIRARRLDRNRPLWELWLLTGMPNQRIGMFVRLHHCVADGMAGIATIGTLLDLEPDTPLTPAEPWTPAPRPADAELEADASHRRAGVWRHAPERMGRVLHELPALRELFFQPTLRSTSLDVRVGGGRKVALVRYRLDMVTAVAHANRAKVNDVFLAAVAAGLRALLRSRGESVDGEVIRIYVPMSLHSGQRESARGNEITQMVVELPIDEPDSATRVRLIAEETARGKARTRPSVGGMPVHGLAGRALLKLIERQRVNVESADLPGPPIPLYLAGAPVLEVFPLLPLIGHVSLGVGALSYAGQFNIGVVADRDTYPDLDLFVAAVRADLRSLEATIPSPAVA